VPERADASPPTPSLRNVRGRGRCASSARRWTGPTRGPRFIPAWRTG